jgi:hypothetical protein
MTGFEYLFTFYSILLGLAIANIATELVAPAATRWTLQIPGFDPFLLDIAAYVVMYPFLFALALFDWRTWGKLLARPPSGRQITIIWRVPARSTYTNNDFKSKFVSPA